MDFPYKAIQYDVSRGRIPRLATVRDRLDFLTPYGLNMLCFYIESVFESDTLPAVGCGATPLTKAYLSELKRICDERGVLFTPIMQILGHQEKLLALDAYQHLGERVPPENGSGANNFLPADPAVLETLFAWLDEMLPFVSSPFLHVGCDEVWTLGQGRSREAVRERGAPALIAEHIDRVNGFLKSRGKTLVLWGDLAIDYPELVSRLPEDVVISNWGYGTMDETFERENHHFAMHGHLASAGHRLWVCGNSMAEYIFTPFHRLESNTQTWMDLAQAHGAEAFLITDWGSYENVNPFCLSSLGDLYILMKVADPGVSQEQFLCELSCRLLGRRDGALTDAMRLMLNVQGNTDYFPVRDIRFFPCLPGLMLTDPASGSTAARRFGCYEQEGLDRFLADMRRALKLMESIQPDGAPRPDDVRDLTMLANRLVTVGLRARLWYDYAWDTSYRWPDAPHLDDCRRRAGRRQEYLERSGRDIAWYEQRWREENLETEWPRCRALLTGAVDSVAAIVGEDGELLSP